MIGRINRAEGSGAMPQGVNQLPPLVDDPTVKDTFSDQCAGLSFANGNVHLTFVSVTADHSSDPSPSRRVVTARLGMPINGAMELRDNLTALIDLLQAQGAITTVPIPPTVVNPGRPN
jgi:hypothetical protein